MGAATDLHMKKSKKIGTILRGVLAGCLAALAAGVPRAAEHIEMHFDRIGIADGLSQSMVMAIEQDAEGFMWFGTENGLDRWDGRRAEHFRPGPSSLSDDDLASLAVEGDSLWNFDLATTSMRNSYLLERPCLVRV